MAFAIDYRNPLAFATSGLTNHINDSNQGAMLVDHELRESTQRVLAHNRELIQHAKKTVLEIKCLCEQTREQIVRSQVVLMKSDSRSSERRDVPK